MSKRVFLILAAVLTTAPVFAQPVVTLVSPIGQALDADQSTHLVVKFDRPLDTSTVSSASFRAFGRWSGPASGTLSFEDGDATIRFVPSEPFFTGEPVTVSLSKSIKDATGAALAKGYAWHFWIRSGPGTLQLTEIGSTPVRSESEVNTSLHTYGAYAGDIDNDGWSDLIVPNELPNDVRIFMNDAAGGFGPFTEIAFSSGSDPSTNEGADFDGDGNIDVAIGSSSSDVVNVLMGDGIGGFATPSPYTTAPTVKGLCVLDLDADGDDDIVTANKDADSISLLLNDGSGSFTSGGTVDTGGLGEYGCAVADANEDGVMDLFVGAHDSAELVLLLGDGDGNLTFETKVAVAGTPWMMASGDVNGDGHADVAIADGFGHTTTVVLGDGAGGLMLSNTYATEELTVAVDLGDIDGDGDLDMVSSSVRSGLWIMYENDGSGNFINRRDFVAPDQAACAILHDRDNDGDLDMTAIDEGSDELVFFDNDPAALGVELIGFDVLTVGDDLVLRWSTASEIDNAGFEIEQKVVTSFDTAAAWAKVGFVAGNGTTSALHDYSFSLAGGRPGRYRFRLKQLDLDGTVTYSNEVLVVLELPTSISLSKAFPNPTDHDTRLTLVVGRPQQVDVTLYDQLGRVVQVAYSGYLNSHERFPVVVDGSNLPSGTYFVRASGVDAAATQRIVLLR